MRFRRGGEIGAPGLAYDPTTQFYYDPKTLYYWDATTGYYYDGTSGTYLTLDPQSQAYTPVTASLQAKYAPHLPIHAWYSPCMLGTHHTSYLPPVATSSSYTPVTESLQAEYVTAVVRQPPSIGIHPQQSVLCRPPRPPMGGDLRRWVEAARSLLQFAKTGNVALYVMCYVMLAI